MFSMCGILCRFLRGWKQREAITIMVKATCRSESSLVIEGLGTNFIHKASSLENEANSLFCQPVCNASERKQKQFLWKENGKQVFLTSPKERVDIVNWALLSSSFSTNHDASSYTQSCPPSLSGTPPTSCLSSRNNSLLDESEKRIPVLLEASYSDRVAEPLPGYNVSVELFSEPYAVNIKDIFGVIILTTPKKLVSMVYAFFNDALVIHENLIIQKMLTVELEGEPTSSGDLLSLSDYVAQFLESETYLSGASGTSDKKLNLVKYNRSHECQNVSVPRPIRPLQNCTDRNSLYSSKELSQRGWMASGLKSKSSHYTSRKVVVGQPTSVNAILTTQGSRGAIENPPLFETSIITNPLNELLSDAKGSENYTSSPFFCNGDPNFPIRNPSKKSQNVSLLLRHTSSFHGLNSRRRFRSRGYFVDAFYRPNFHQFPLRMRSEADLVESTLIIRDNLANIIENYLRKNPKPGKAEPLGSNIPPVPKNAKSSDDTKSAQMDSKFKEPAIICSSISLALSCDTANDSYNSNEPCNATSHPPPAMFEQYANHGKETINEDEAKLHSDCIDLNISKPVLVNNSFPNYYMNERYGVLRKYEDDTSLNSSHHADMFESNYNTDMYDSNHHADKGESTHNANVTDFTGNEKLNDVLDTGSINNSSSEMNDTKRATPKPVNGKETSLNSDFDLSELSTNCVSTESNGSASDNNSESQEDNSFSLDSLTKEVCHSGKMTLDLQNQEGCDSSVSTPDDFFTKSTTPEMFPAAGFPDHWHQEYMQVFATANYSISQDPAWNGDVLEPIKELDTISKGSSNSFDLSEDPYTRSIAETLASNETAYSLMFSSAKAMGDNALDIRNSSVVHSVPQSDKIDLNAQPSNVMELNGNLVERNVATVHQTANLEIIDGVDSILDKCHDSSSLDSKYTVTQRDASELCTVDSSSNGNALELHDISMQRSDHSSDTGMAIVNCTCYNTDAEETMQENLCKFSQSLQTSGNIFASTPSSENSLTGPVNSVVNFKFKDEIHSDDSGKCGNSVISDNFSILENAPNSDSDVQTTVRHSSANGNQMQYAVDHGTEIASEIISLNVDHYRSDDSFALNIALSPDSVPESGFASLKDGSHSEATSESGYGVPLSKSRDSFEMTENDKNLGIDSLSDEFDSLSTIVGNNAIFASCSTMPTYSFDENPMNFGQPNEFNIDQWDLAEQSERSVLLSTAYAVKGKRNKCSANHERLFSRVISNEPDLSLRHNQGRVIIGDDDWQNLAMTTQLAAEVLPFDGNPSNNKMLEANSDTVNITKFSRISKQEIDLTVWEEGSMKTEQPVPGLTNSSQKGEILKVTPIIEVAVPFVGKVVPPKRKVTIKAAQNEADLLTTPDNAINSAAVMHFHSEGDLGSSKDFQKVASKYCTKSVSSFHTSSTSTSSGEFSVEKVSLKSENSLDKFIHFDSIAKRKKPTDASTGEGAQSEGAKNSLKKKRKGKEEGSEKKSTFLSIKGFLKKNKSKEKLHEEEDAKKSRSSSSFFKKLELKARSLSFSSPQMGMRKKIIPSAPMQLDEQSVTSKSPHNQTNDKTHLMATLGKSSAVVDVGRLPSHLVKTGAVPHSGHASEIASNVRKLSVNGSPKLYRRVLIRNHSNSSQESLDSAVNERAKGHQETCEQVDGHQESRRQAFSHPENSASKLDRTFSLTTNYKSLQDEDRERKSRTLSVGDNLHRLSRSLTPNKRSSSTESTGLAKRSSSIEILVHGKIREHSTGKLHSGSREGSFRLHREISVETVFEIPQDDAVVERKEGENYQDYLDRMQKWKDSHQSSFWSLCENNGSFSEFGGQSDFSFSSSNPSQYNSLPPNVRFSHSHDMYLAGLCQETSSSNPNLSRNPSHCLRSIPMSSSFTSSPFRRCNSLTSNSPIKRGFSTQGKNVTSPTNDSCPASPLVEEEEEVDMNKNSLSPNVLIYASNNAQYYEDIKITLQNSFNRDRYIVYHLTDEMAFKSPWTTNTTLLVICGDVPTHVSTVFIRYLLEGGRVLSICSDFFNVAVPLFGTVEVQESPVISLTYRSWKNVQLLHHQHCFHSSPKHQRFSRDLDCQKPSPNTTVSVEPTSVEITDENGVHRKLDLRVLAKDDTWGSPSIIAASVNDGSGKAIFSQVHLERDLSQSIAMDLKEPQLKMCDKSRLAILRDLLHYELGLDTSLGQSEERDIAYTPAYLLGRHELKEKFMAHLREYLSNDEISMQNLTLHFAKDNTTEVKPRAQYLPVLSGYPINFSTVKYFEALKTNVFGRLVMYCDKLASTMNVLSGRIPLANGFAVIAMQQSIGKGRQCNVWLSPLGCAMFSIQVHLPLASNMGQRLPFLQHLVAVSVVLSVKGIKGYEGIPLKLKWPNDIYLNDTKIGGVLVEANTNKGTCIANIGCGINLSNSTPTTCINDAIQTYNKENKKRLKELERETLLANCFNRLETLLENFQSDGPESIIKEYYNHWMHGDANVVVRNQLGHTDAATIIGIDGYGFLVARLRTSDEVITLHPDGNSFNMMEGLIYTKVSNI